ncbi:hypothetical protein [Actinophytocola gossypii]
MPPGGPRRIAPGVVLDVGTTDGRKAVIGSVVAGILGLLAVVSGVLAASDDGVGVGIVLIVVGVLLLLPGVFALVARDKLFRPRRLVIEPPGLRWDDPKGAPWAVRWNELAAVAVTRRPVRRFTVGVSDAIAHKASDKLLGDNALVWLDLYPADPGFATRHPELAHLWQHDGLQHGYRFPLGGNVRFVPGIEHAVGRFAPHLWRGVTEI